MYKFVTVKFNNSHGCYDYLCEFEDVKPGDIVRVLTARGEQAVEVVNVFWSDGDDLELPLYKYKHILGKSDSVYLGVVESYGPKRYVNVIFNYGSYEYSYACADSTIAEGSFVRVRAAGTTKTAKVVSVFFSDSLNYRSIVREATEDEVAEVYADFLSDNEYCKYMGIEDEEEEDEEEPDWEAEDDFSEGDWSPTSNLVYAESEVTITEPSHDDLVFDYRYSWHPLNIYYDDDKPKYDHSRMTDDNGWMVNGKWLAEHERNQSNPGSMFDSRGYLKDPYYEECLKNNFFPDDDPRFMTDEQYREYEAKLEGEYDDDD